MRQLLVENVARQLGAIISRRVSVAVGLWGEPGIGKSHTAQAVLGRMPSSSVILHATVPLLQLSRALAQVRALPGWAGGQLSRLERGEVLDTSAAVQMLAAMLGALAPFVLHLEDLHEADQGRLEMIQGLAQVIRRTRGVGLLVTSRAELSEPFLGYRLEPLTEMESGALLVQELKDVPPDALAYVAARTRGNPLFMLEFARSLKRQGFLWSDGERWHWRPPPESFVPVTVEALLEQFVQYAAHTPELMAVLGARAMLGPAVDLSLWREISGLHPQTFEACGATLERSGILRLGGLTHPLIREIVARGLESGERLLLARRALGALEHDPEAAAPFVDAADLKPEERRVWFERAAASAEAGGRGAQAGRWLARAVEDACGPHRGSLARQAAHHLNNVDLPQAIRLLETALSEDPTDARTVILLATAHARMGQAARMHLALARLPPGATVQEDWVKSLMMLRHGQRDYAGVAALWNDHPELHRGPDPLTAYRASFAFMMLNDPERAEALVLPALQQPNLSTLHRMTLLSVVGLTRRLTGDLGAARSFLNQAVTCAQECGPANQASMLNNRQIVLGMLGLYPEKVADLREATERYREAGIPLNYASTLSSLGSVLAVMGQFQEAEERLLEARELLSRYEDTGYLCSAELNLCDLYLIWRPPHGLRLAQRYAHFVLNRARTLTSHLGSALCTVSTVATAAGQADQGLALADECLQLDQINAQVRSQALLAQAGALEGLGLPVAAVQALELARVTAISDYERTWIGFELARLQGDKGAARALLEHFEQRGLLGAASHALQKWPRLTPEAADLLPQDRGESNQARLNVLGSLTLERGGLPVQTRARKRLQILAYLLETRIAGRSEASALELVDALYSETPEVDAKNTLKQQVYLIRSSLGSESVWSTPTGYALGAVTSDAEDFLRSSDPHLWRGVYLSGLGEGWRAGVREALTLGLQAAAETQLKPDPREAARLGAILIELEPYDQRALHLGVRALAHTGDLPAARRLFLAARSRLEEVGEALPATLEAFFTAQSTARVDG